MSACPLKSKHIKSHQAAMSDNSNTHHMLYTPEQKIRRDESVWTLVQGILAPVQFLIFLVRPTLSMTLGPPIYKLALMQRIWS
jgi:hypothetical protein